jgi:hypothetical protein
MHSASGMRLSREGPGPEDSGRKHPRKTRRWLLVLIPLLAAVGLILGLYWSRPQAKASPKTFAMGWRPVVSWSGHGSTQTESFNIETGQWRIKWATRPQSRDSQTQATHAQATQAEHQQSEDKQVFPMNKFRLVVHSSVSGRFVTVAAEHQGAGNGIAYLAEEPRQFFLVIESGGLDWTVQVEEGIEGQPENSP